ncbi:MAG TPA: hypothetical protein VGI88_02500 [Verrucomicrobiae bacterium]
MPLPETISVRYTEEEAGYVTVRPLVRQTFSMDELLDMILSVAGKDLTRVQQLLHSGTVVYHFYRYTWTGLDADEAELAAALAKFPDADPSRPFASNLCTNAVFDGPGANPRHLLDLAKDAASRRRIFRGQSFWQRLMDIASEENLMYEKYSYSRRADLYRVVIDSENVLKIAEAADQLASGKLRPALRVVNAAASISFVCPR